MKRLLQYILVGAMLVAPLGCRIAESQPPKPENEPKPIKLATAEDIPSADDIATKVVRQLDNDLNTKIKRLTEENAGLKGKVEELSGRNKELTQRVNDLQPYKVKYEAVLAGKSPLIAMNANAVNDNGYQLMTLEEYLMQEEKLTGNRIRLSGRPVAVTFAGGDILDIVLERDGKTLHCSSFSGGSSKQKITLREIPASQLYNEVVLLVEKGRNGQKNEIIVYGEGNNDLGFLIHTVKLSPQESYEILKIERNQ